ncbi:MAG: hypothetical protein AB1757_21625 [Acidobacteriota bacterium]
MNKNTLTIKKYWNSGADLVFEVGEGFLLKDSIKGTVRITRLTVYRKPDKHSTRINMFAQLRNRGLGFFEVILTRDRYADSGQFLSRTTYTFTDVGVESLYMRDNREELTLICSGYTEK